MSAQPAASGLKILTVNGVMLDDFGRTVVPPPRNIDGASRARAQSATSVHYNSPPATTPCAEHNAMPTLASGGSGCRGSILAQREADLAAHLDTVERILDAANKRDIEADARDQISVERDHAADLRAFTSTEGRNGYGADLPARRHAALDRHDA